MPGRLVVDTQQLAAQGFRVEALDVPGGQEHSLPLDAAAMLWELPTRTFLGRECEGPAAVLTWGTVTVWRCPQSCCPCRMFRGDCQK